MHIQYSKQEEQFREEVRKFIRQYFTPQAPYRETAQQRELWERALVEKGWSAYRWPVAHGGCRDPGTLQRDHLPGVGQHIPMRLLPRLAQELQGLAEPPGEIRDPSAEAPAMA